jgi:hypothetical protein
MTSPGRACLRTRVLEQIGLRPTARGDGVAGLPVRECCVSAACTRTGRAGRLRRGSSGQFEKRTCRPLDERITSARAAAPRAAAPPGSPGRGAKQTRRRSVMDGMVPSDIGVSTPVPAPGFLAAPSGREILSMRHTSAWTGPEEDVSLATPRRCSPGARCGAAVAPSSTCTSAAGVDGQGDSSDKLVTVDATRIGPLRGVFCCQLADAASSVARHERRPPPPARPRVVGRCSSSTSDRTRRGRACGARRGGATARRARRDAAVFSGRAEARPEHFVRAYRREGDALLRVRARLPRAASASRGQWCSSPLARATHIGRFSLSRSQPARYGSCPQGHRHTLNPKTAPR